MFLLQLCYIARAYRARFCMKQRIYSPQHGRLIGSLRPPGSKSISNRVLIIRALLGDSFAIENLSSARDTQSMQRLLKYRKELLLDAGDAGTTYRFLTAFLSLQEGRQMLTGSRRMLQRPIGALVEALRSLGADIRYLGKEGYPPLLIGDRKLFQCDRLSIAGDISSQYISALLLIAPLLPNGLSIDIRGELVSRPYVQMTLDIMAEFGILYSWRIEECESIYVPKQDYEFHKEEFWVESDWSSASYFFALAALSQEADIQLLGLKKNSWQGDIRIVDFMRHFGVESSFYTDFISLRKSPQQRKQKLIFDCLQCPDLAQTLAVVAAAKQQPLRLEGLQTLKIKETDRLLALQTELQKLGARISIDENSLEIYEGIALQALQEQSPTIQSYQDHRMALAFAPLALLCPRGLSIEEPQVVQKSYPHFWEDLEKLGFSFEAIYK